MKLKEKNGPIAWRQITKSLNSYVKIKTYVFKLTEAYVDCSHEFLPVLGYYLIRVCYFTLHFLLCLFYEEQGLLHFCLATDIA